jgi:hypothetical protein
LVREAEEPADAHVVGSAGQRVAGPPEDQVPRVAGPLAEPVRLLEHLAVVGVEHAGVDQAMQAFDRRGRADLGRRSAVLELEELHGELHVGERALGQLEVELRILAGRDPLLLDADLHPADLVGELVGPGFPDHEPLHHRHEPRAEVGVARDGSRAQE